MSAEAETLPSLTTTPDETAAGPDGSLRADAALLVARLAVGVAVAMHGAQKLFGWWSGPGRDGTEQLVAAAGYPQAKIMAWVLSCAEVAGGVGLVLGVLTPLAGAAVLGVMINASALSWGFGWRGPWFEAGGGIELELLLAAGAVGVALAGPGRLSVDAFVPGLKRNSFAFALAGVAVGVLSGVGVLFWRAYG
ncbi:DoxX family protein [Streptomyces sp. NPDC051940]|uniref:DoxX family protein n=1 Tax=Streptomyces sp. NPDC051940 TaxID=3155675 RepID=UPI00344138C5